MSRTLLVTLLTALVPAPLLAQPERDPLMPPEGWPDAPAVAPAGDEAAPDGAPSSAPADTARPAIARQFPPAPDPDLQADRELSEALLRALREERRAAARQEADSDRADAGLSCELHVVMFREARKDAGGRFNNAWETGDGDMDTAVGFSLEAWARPVRWLTIRSRFWRVAAEGDRTLRGSGVEQSSSYPFELEARRVDLRGELWAVDSPRVDLDLLLGLSYLWSSAAFDQGINASERDVVETVVPAAGIAVRGELTPWLEALGELWGGGFTQDGKYNAYSVSLRALLRGQVTDTFRVAFGFEGFGFMLEDESRGARPVLTGRGVNLALRAELVF